MVKKWIVMILLTFCLCFACVYETKYINKTFGELINTLETLQIELAENKDEINKEYLVTKSYKIHENWKKNIRKIKCIIWHTGIKDVEVSLARIPIFVEENEYADAYAEIAGLIDYVAHYLDDFSVSLENIL